MNKQDLRTGMIAHHRDGAIRLVVNAPVQQNGDVIEGVFINIANGNFLRFDRFNDYLTHDKKDSKDIVKVTQMSEFGDFIKYIDSGDERYLGEIVWEVVPEDDVIAEKAPGEVALDSNPSDGDRVGDMEKKLDALENNLTSLIAKIEEALN